MIKNIGIFKDFSDNSLKSVFDIGNNQIIEMTLLANKEQMDVICVPTHHFCNLGCKMCHLTNKGLNKSMVPIKSDDFIKCLIQTLTKQGERRTSKKKLLISFMGVGEPLLNLKLIEEVYKMENIIKDKLGYENIGYALATMMPNNNILKLTELVNRLNIPLKIHFSMHTPIDNNRFDLIPSTKVTVEEALTYLIHYRNNLQSNDKIMSEYIKLHRTNDPVEIHYTLIKDVNDSQKELKKVCELLSKYRIPIKFIRFNPLNDLKISENEQIWIDEISKKVSGLRIKTYSPPGREIGSSCGEFTKHYYHQEIETEEEKNEFEKWKAKHQIFQQQRDDNFSWDEYFDDAPLNTKYMYVVPAERNTILNYQEIHKNFENTKIYVNLFPYNEYAKEDIYLSDKYAKRNETIASKKPSNVCEATYKQLDKIKQKVLKLSLEVK